eukprot:scaffold1546_cov109-Isochrysis_galbana.AAC.1
MLLPTKVSGGGGGWVWESLIAVQSLCPRFYDDFVFMFGDTTGFPYGYKARSQSNFRQNARSQSNFARSQTNFISNCTVLI